MTTALTTTVADLDGSFTYWCNYHLQFIDYLILWMDDPTGFDVDLLPRSDRIIVQAGNQYREGSSLSSLMLRQEHNIRHALNICIDLNSDWLFNIDSDELLFPLGQNGLAELCDCNIGQITLLNHEVCPVWESTNPFLDCTHFKLNGRMPFNFYKNGKSAVRCQPAVEPNGLHSFRGFSGSHRHADGACILHYCCPTFDRWQRKFAKLGTYSDWWYDNPANPITLPFYIESRDIYKRCEQNQNWSEAYNLFARQLLSETDITRLLKIGCVAEFRTQDRGVLDGCKNKLR